MISLWSLVQQGGIALIPLGVCSVLIVAVFFDRLWNYLRIGKAPRELLRRAEHLISAGDWHGAVRLLDDTDSPYARIAKAGIMREHANEQELSDILTGACDAELAEASRPVPILGTIGNIAPFIGLFGTVIGIMRAFHSLAQQKAAGMEVVMAGISEALIATAAGLLVGICAVIFNNWCNAWLERYRISLERFATEWSYLLQHVQAEKETVEPRV